MKREEFPTFLNEQPTIIFNRTGRELLVIVIGLGAAYLSWLRFGNFAGNIIVSDILKGMFAAIVIIVGLIVAFVKVATRPLEEWAFVWIFYMLIPKVYLYMPAKVTVALEQNDGEEEIEAGTDGDVNDDY